MKFPYLVTHNGIDYPIGADVPIEEETAPVKQEETVIDTVEEKVEEPTIEEPTFEYTKTEIKRMPIAELKKIAKANDIDDTMSGADIKEAIIKKFGL